MCGIAGYIDLRRQSSSETLVAKTSRMCDAIAHRGPDDSGIWVDPAAGIALGHRRLSILDLSPTGRQPMESSSGRFVVVFNGEIYNFKDLRQELAGLGRQFQGTSDTEILLAAVEEWGLLRALSKAVGMFAFALWDRQRRELSLVRDRMGEKPLYYGRVGQNLFFASEIKAIQAHPEFSGSVHVEAVSAFLRYGYVPTPYSIYRELKKLRPGHLVTLPVSDSGTEDLGSIAYWSIHERAQDLARDRAGMTESAAVRELDRLLRTAVQQQMVADVPVGIFLSGGVDSSLIAAFAQQQATKPVKTFSIGFDDKRYNEADHARQVAMHLGTEHQELYVSAADSMAVIPALSHFYDEPFADSSQIPTYLLAKLAREQVTVALCGDGSDEIFGGYNRYMWVNGIAEKTAMVPTPFRRLLAAAIQGLSPRQWDQLYGWIPQSLLPKSFRLRLPGEKIHKLAHVLNLGHGDSIYQNLVSVWKNPEEVVLPFSGGKHEVAPTLLPGRFGTVERMMILDALTYLPDDILVKVDRASMATSLETRVPYLDHRVVEFAWSLPLSFKIGKGVSKRLLRDILYRHVPPSLVERPKMGFALPIDNWLRTSLRDWAEDLLDERKLAQQGLLNPQIIQRTWKDHLSGRGNYQHELWAVLMLQAWLRKESNAGLAWKMQPSALPASNLVYTST